MGSKSKHFFFIRSSPFQVSFSRWFLRRLSSLDPPQDLREVSHLLLPSNVSLSFALQATLPLLLRLVRSSLPSSFTIISTKRSSSVRAEREWSRSLYSNYAIASSVFHFQTHLRLCVVLASDARCDTHAWFLLTTSAAAVYDDRFVISNGRWRMMCFGTGVTFSQDPIVFSRLISELPWRLPGLLFAAGKPFGRRRRVSGSCS